MPLSGGLSIDMANRGYMLSLALFDYTDDVMATWGGPIDFSDITAERNLGAAQRSIEFSPSTLHRAVCGGVIGRCRSYDENPSSKSVRVADSNVNGR